MKNVADEDTRRLIESQHDVSVDADVVAQNKQEQASFAYTQERLRKARVKLLAAVLLARKESAQTLAAREALEQAVKPAVAYYGFARTRTRTDLLDLDPLGPQPDPAAQVQLAREWQDAFGQAPSTLDRLGADEQIARLDTLCGLLAQSAPLSAHAASAQLRALVDTAQAALARHAKEVKEDSAAMSALRDARALFDRADSAHRLQVRALLVGQGREELLGAAIRAEEPAYKARRLANAPIAQDPLVEDLKPELPDTP